MEAFDGGAGTDDLFGCSGLSRFSGLFGLSGAMNKTGETDQTN